MYFLSPHLPQFLQSEVSMIVTYKKGPVKQGDGIGGLSYKKEMAGS